MAIDQSSIRVLSNGEDFLASILNRPTLDLVSQVDLEIARVENKLSDYLPVSGGSITGDLTIQGNLTVQGDTVQIDSQITTTDTVVILNDGEVGSGVTAGFSGVEIDRGTLVNYKFGFDESSGLFKLGKIGDLQSVATRNDSQVDNGVMQWNQTDNTMYSTLPTVVDTTSPSSNSGELNTVLGMLGNRIKAITGLSDWKSPPSTTLEDLYNNSINASFATVEANELIWEDGINRITSNDGGGNVQIRFGHKYDTSEVFTHSNTAFYIGGSLDSSSGALTLKVASNGGAGEGQTVTWGSSLEIGSSTLRYGGNAVWTAGNDGSGSGLDADTVDGIQGSSIVQTSRTINSGTGLTGGGNLTTNRTFSLREIYAGQNIEGALWYHGTTRTAARLYGGGTNPAANNRLNYDGYFWATRFYTPSSIRYKNIDYTESLQTSLDKVVNIGSKGVKVGHYKESETKETIRWFIAEEVNEVTPEAVTKDEKGRPDGIDSDQLIPDLYAAIAELTKRVKELEARG